MLVPGIDAPTREWRARIEESPGFIGEVRAVKALISRQLVEESALLARCTLV